MIGTAGIEEMAKGIIYEPTDEKDWWDANAVFWPAEPKSRVPATRENPDPKSGLAEAPVGGVNLYDHFDYDSHVERNFAEQLENDSDRIKLFAKLPRRFKVRTPVGEYSPDWVIVCDVDGADRLCLVRETKDKLSLHQLAWDEAMKVRFALRHFYAAPDGRVDYTNTTDHDGLRIELTLGGETQ